MGGIRRSTRIASASVAWLLAWLSPTTADAVQAHGDPEGFVVHQIGHVLLVIGMLILLAQLYRGRIHGAGWRYFRGFLWLVILWSASTFAGHWIQGTGDLSKLTMAEHYPVAMLVTDIGDWLFYLSHLDHVILAPAFLLLFLALRRWGKQP